MASAQGKLLSVDQTMKEGGRRRKTGVEEEGELVEKESRLLVVVVETRAR